MVADLPRRFPSPPAALSPFQLYLNPPRTSSVRFRLSPPFLLAGIELALSLSLSSVGDDLRPAFFARRDRLPPRRRLLRLRRILADLVHLSVLVADRLSAAVPVDLSRATASLRSGRLLRRRRHPGVSRGPSPPFPLPSPLSAAAPPRLWPPPVTIGARARRLPPTVPAWPPSGAPSGCHVEPGRQPPAPSDAAASEDPLFVEVEADVWESEQGKSHHP
uniref:HGWP repeat containing protein-like n=1 Tax=Oryza sativa subsp. japonica TaxID=39947 RepID=Q69TN2_ORYSJ|nr:HGWP repeat containing protein-like [Oryza sativa Japonica Group]